MASLQNKFSGCLFSSTPALHHVGMSLFHGKYRTESTRLPGRDYRLPGMYFVTICTKNRRHSFGCVRDGKMHLSDIGKIVADEWQRTSIVRSNVFIDEWVIMPDHLHGIIVIRDMSTNIPAIDFPAIDMPVVTVETPRRGVSTTRAFADKSVWASGCLGAIINQFKSVCTKRIRAAGFIGFAWQTRFHDYVIRDESSLYHIRHYIRENPRMWDAGSHDDATVFML